MSRDIVPADKEFRKRFVAFLMLIIIVFVFAIVSMKSHLDQMEQLRRENPGLAGKKVVLLLKWWMGLGSLPILGLAVYQIILARRILKSDRFPPPGMKMIRDTKVQTGAQARKMAISLIALSSLMSVVILFLVCLPFAFEKKLLKKSSDVASGVSEKERRVIELKEKGGETN